MVHNQARRLWYQTFERSDTYNNAANNEAEDVIITDNSSSSSESSPSMSPRPRGEDYNIIRPGTGGSHHHDHNNHEQHHPHQAYQKAATFDDDDKECEQGIQLATHHGSSATSSSDPMNRELLWLVLGAATTAATLGYDVGIMAAAIQPLTADFALTGVQKEVAMGSLNFVAAFGALIGGPWADRRGRKSTIRLCSVLFLIGTAGMCLAPNYACLVLGRMITGLGVGVAFVVAPVYISEVAPPQQRGALNTTFDVAINGGILAGYVTGYLVQVAPFILHKWRVMLGLGAVLPVAVLILLPHLPESPRWFMLRRQTLAAEGVLRRLGLSDDEIAGSIQAMEQELAVTAAAAAPAAFHNGSSDSRENGIRKSSSSSSSGLLCCSSNNNNNKKCTSGQRLAVQLGFWQQITGTEAVLYYSADFLARAGLESPELRLLGNCCVGVCKLVPEWIAMHRVDDHGRRPFLLASSLALTTATGFLALAFQLQWPPLAVVALLCAVMASFSAGLGPFTFLCASENLDLQERAAGMTLCAAVNRCTSGVVALSAVSLSEALGDAGLFALYAALGVASFGFYALAVPETAGASLEELAESRRLAESERNGLVSGLNNSNGATTAAIYRDDALQGGTELTSPGSSSSSSPVPARGGTMA